MSLERTTQLINKSNQLDTREPSPHGGRAFWPWWPIRSGSPGPIRSRDRFGDNGLISVLLAKREDDALVIDTWLMSCRVLKSSVETLLHNYLCRSARRRGLHRIRGEYIATAKNGIVKDHYVGLGFFRIEENHPGTVWEFVIADDWTAQATQIVEEDGFPTTDTAFPCFPSRIQP